MASGFGSLFDPECNQESAASRLGQRFGLNSQNELSRGMTTGQGPSTFNMSEILDSLNGGAPAIHPRPQNAERQRVLSSDTQPSHLSTVPPRFPTRDVTPFEIQPFGYALDFHYANVGPLPPPPLLTQTHPVDPTPEYHDPNEWDNRLLSLSWQEANNNSTIHPPSDLSEIPWEEAKKELEDHDFLSSQFWTEQLRSDRLNRPVQYEFEYPEPELASPEDDLSEEDWALNEGRRALQAGDVPTAVYFLESAVRSNPQNSEAWYQLGTAQQLNENDKAAIAALQKCLALNEKHPLARIALAASFTNELRRADALISLAEWTDLHLSPDGEDAAKRRLRWQALGDFGGYTFQHQLFTEAEERLLQILETNPSEEVAANVEASLGILYNISEDYEKAASHFEKAIVHRPDDAVLYNRLGASLANGDRNADAIAAYCRALEISPGLLRTRYNLGIASCNMHAHKEAVHHFLTVLNKQSDTRSTFVGVPPPPNVSNLSSASSNVWSSLRMAFLAMDRRDLYDLALDQKLQELNTAFNVPSE